MGIVRARDDSCKQRRDLPVRRRIDTALNKSTGRLWVVKEDFGVSRVEFEMDEPVRFWGGIVGVLRNTVGRRCCMNTRCGWGGVARTSRDPPQEPHYGDEVEGSSHV